MLDEKDVPTSTTPLATGRTDYNKFTTYSLFCFFFHPQFHPSIPSQLENVCDGDESWQSKAVRWQSMGNWINNTIKFYARQCGNGLQLTVAKEWKTAPNCIRAQIAIQTLRCTMATLSTFLLLFKNEDAFRCRQIGWKILEKRIDS